MIDQRIFRQMTSRANTLLDKPLSRRGHVFLGTRCSYKCSFCYYRNRRDENFYPAEKVLDYIEFIHRYGIRDIEYTGGEPSQYKGLDEIIHKVHDEYGMVQAMITNGVKGDYSKYIDAGISEILFSCHGYSRESHDMITGIRGSWDRLNQSMRNVINKVLIRVNVTICKYNYQNLMEQAKYLTNEYPIFAVNYLPLNTWDDAEDISVPYKKYVDSLIPVVEYLKKRQVNIAIRYIPFCAVNKSLHKYVYNHIHHAYDPYDWNQELDGHTIYPRLLEKPYGYYTAEAVLNKREKMYTKMFDCVECEHFYECDGFQNKQLEREGI